MTETKTEKQQVKIKQNKKESVLSLRINRYYTDTNGMEVNKAAVPASLQIAFPFYLLGEFDRAGGYKQGNAITPPKNGSEYVGSFIIGEGAPFLGFNPFNTIGKKLLLGDLAHVFTDNVLLPTFYVFIVQSAQTVSLCSVLSNSKSGDKSLVKNFNYFTDNADQWYTELNFISFNVAGEYLKDFVSPFMFRFPETPDRQGQFITVEMTWELSQYVEIASYMEYATDSILLNFNLTL